MVDVLPPVGAYPKWEVNGTATEGYITISVMQNGSIFVKQEMKTGAKTLLKTLQAINNAVTIKEEPMDEDDPVSANPSSTQSTPATVTSDGTSNTTVYTKNADIALCTVTVNLQKPFEEDFHAPTDDQEPPALEEEAAGQEQIEPVLVWPNLVAATKFQIPFGVKNGNGQLVLQDSGSSVGGVTPLKTEPVDEMGKNSSNAITKAFTCDLCKVTFETKEWLEIHICSKEKKKEYICTLCNAKYKSAAMLNTHIIKYHQQREQKPKKPKEKKVTSPSPYKDLLNLNPTYGCELCRKEFGWKQELQIHMEIEHEMFTMKHECKHCKKPYDSAAQLDAHACVVLECELCKLMFPSKKERDKHWEENHDIRFKCSRCTRAFKSQFDLNRHMNTHPKTTCEICGKSFPFQGRLDKHMQTVHRLEINFQGPKISFPCEKCGKAYKNKSSLHEHKVGEHGLPGNYNCEICGKQFWLKTRLDMHVRSHTGERPFQCTTCGKAFTLYSSLYVHMKKHDNEKRHECSICGTSFASNYYLKEHMKGHDGSSSVQCKTCGKWLKNKGVLRSHEVAHKDERKYKCHICGTGYNHSGSLHTHMKKHNESPQDMEFTM